VAQKQLAQSADACHVCTITVYLPQPSEETPQANSAFHPSGVGK